MGGREGGKERDEGGREGEEGGIILGLGLLFKINLNSYAAGNAMELILPFKRTILRCISVHIQYIH